MSGGLTPGMLFGLIFMLAGLAFKISAAPFHMWTPDVYQGAPTPVTMFFASAPKVAAVVLLTRVSMEAFGTQVDAWRQVVIAAALLSIVIGALGAIGQDNMKRLLAYSSINNVGFILIGLAAGTAAGASALLVYLAIYVVMTIGSFVAVLLLRDAEGSQLEAVSRPCGPFHHPPGHGMEPDGADVQPCGHSAAVRLLGQIRRVSGGGGGRPAGAGRHRHCRHR